MTAFPTEKLDRLVDRWTEVQERLNSAPAQDVFIKLSKEFAELSPVVAEIQSLRKAEADVAEMDKIVSDPTSEKDMVDLAYAERAELKEKIDALRQKLRIALLPKDAADEKSAIIEVRAGTGGDEAALFAADLFRMYSRYADLHGWKVEIISASENDLGGYKEIIASVAGAGVFARLKFESGVHRVQRIPATESGGRIHTSAATVAVLPEAEELEIDVKQEDIRIDTMRASGAGGQHVNKTDSAVRITHLPTGIVVVSAEKSQHQNRRLAMSVLKARLYDLERERASSERTEARRSQVGSGDRSQRIRTYNFPQGRVTDHRINLTLYNLDEVIAGDKLDDLIDALIADHQASLLAELSAA